MTKIFYAVQATGNGHVSRATQLYPYLKKMGHVDFFVSGNNCNLDFNFPVTYRSKGCSLHYSKCGGLNYWGIIKNIKPISLYKDANRLPLNKYDIIINDFDFITSLACKIKGLPSVQFGHQASFQSDLTPRPDEKSIIGETILKKYAPATKYVGLHFNKYDSFIKEPVIKSEFINCEPTNLGHVSVYLPSFQQHCIQQAFLKNKHIQFHWFLDSIKTIYTEQNITYYPVDQSLFNESLKTCHGLITGGGFETPSEALYLGKKLISIPIKNHYEQECNSAALKKLGVDVLYVIDEKFSKIIHKWYDDDSLNIRIEANNIAETLNYVFDTYPKKTMIEKEEPKMMFI